VALPDPTEPAAIGAALRTAAAEPAAVTAAPAPVVLSVAASLAPATLLDESAALDGGALPLLLLLSKATPASAAPVPAAPAIVTARADGAWDLLTIDSAPAAAVPPAYGAAQEAAPPRPEPVLAAAGEALDLLALSSPGVPLGV
jgi:hypothetical protein